MNQRAQACHNITVQGAGCPCHGVAPLPPAELLPLDSRWPGQLSLRLRDAAPPRLHLLGPPEILDTHKTALFCSTRCPADAILRTHQAARRMRDSGITVISGFQSPMEKECLAILLRGKQPIIISVARSLTGMRIPAQCRPAFNEGRILFLSPFAEKPTRITKESAARRNEITAALADEAYIAYAEIGSRTDQIAQRLKEWGVEKPTV